ncbi:MAG: CoA-binding protein [Bdellovibrionota bacterium]
MGQKVAVLGASTKPDRYSYKAFKMLKEYGHDPLPVSPKTGDIEGTKFVASLKDLSGPVDTLTMYVGPEVSTKLENEILKLNPKRVIFNPGSENPNLESSLEKAGVHVVEACTLVLLRTNQFNDA